MPAFGYTILSFNFTVSNEFVYFLRTFVFFPRVLLTSFSAYCNLHGILIERIGLVFIQFIEPCSIVSFARAPCAMNVSTDIYKITCLTSTCDNWQHFHNCPISINKYCKIICRLIKCRKSYGKANRFVARVNFNLSSWNLHTIFVHVLAPFWGLCWVKIWKWHTP